MHSVLEQVADVGSLLEVQPLYGKSIITAFARIGGESVLIVANQPAVEAGTITIDAAEKATHFLRVAGSFGLPVVFLADTPSSLRLQPLRRRGGRREPSRGHGRARRSGLHPGRTRARTRARLARGSEGRNPWQRMKDSTSSSSEPVPME